MTTQNKEESQGACSDSSAEVVAIWDENDNDLFLKGFLFPESEAKFTSLVRQSDYLALQEKVKELEQAMREELALCHELERQLDTMEAKDAEPVAWNVFGINGNGKIYLHSTVYSESEWESVAGILGDSFAGVQELYTSPPTVQAAVAAFKRKAAEVCYDKMANHGDEYMQCAEAILAISADDTALREMLMKVASERDENARLTQEITELTAKLESKEAEPGAWEFVYQPVTVPDVEGATQLRLKVGAQQFNIGDYSDTIAEAKWVANMLDHALRKCTSPPTVQAAVAAALRKAAEVCKNLDNTENSDAYRIAADWCRNLILAIPADETDLREMIDDAVRAGILAAQDQDAKGTMINVRDISDRVIKG